VDRAGNVGQYSSVTMGADGLGLISYYDETNGDLKVAHCSASACTSATLTTVDRAGNVGQYSSVTKGTDGLGLISYYDETNGDLKVAHCSNKFCVPYHRPR
jgi:preprotein translocase subunit Sec61beta